MTVETKFKIIDVNATNIDQTGFFCYMSKRKTEGFNHKLQCLKARFEEGMRIKMFELPERGFIEYIPGEYAWRAVNASGYMFIHCLWVVGKSKGKGLGAVLLDACIEDAKKSGIWEKQSRPNISFEVPKELERALARNKKAKAFFEKLAPTYRKQFIGWISVAKREETRARRVNETIAQLEKGKKLGMKG